MTGETLHSAGSPLGCPFNGVSFVSRLGGRMAAAENRTKGAPMQYMLLIYSGDSMNEFGKLPEDEQKAVLGEYYAISELPGVVGGDQLQPADTATTVRVEGGQALTTDGPFAATKEVLGGYYLLE